MYDRREFMVRGAVGMAALSMGGLGLHGVGRAAADPTGTDWRAALGTSLNEEHDYEPAIEGRLPTGLNGTLYRNGPGLFERGGMRKRHLLDGDGMIQAFDFADGRVRYRNRFVRTEKFKAERKAGAYLHGTWSTRSPSGWLDNLGGGSMKSQAGVTTLVKDDKLLAFDEVERPYVLDPITLATKQQMPILGVDDTLHYKAHTKTDASNGDWVLMSTEFGRVMTVYIVIRGKDGTIKKHIRAAAPRTVYLHDFFVTERHVVVVLHPLNFGMFPFLLGMRSFIDSLEWAPREGNLVMVIDRDGDAAPRFIEAPAAFTWHALNAHARGDEIVADFVGYDAPDHFVGPEAGFAEIMSGRAGRGRHPGKLRRYVIDVGAGKLREDIIAGGHHEFPMTDPRVACTAHRMGYMAAGPAGDWTLNALTGIDTASGRSSRHEFGDRFFVGEPVFAPSGAALDRGWLLSQVHDGDAGTSFLAVLDAANVAAGPLARVRLTHPVPISFHGYWHAS